MSKIVIGLEVHIALSTESKMFCSCSNNPSESEGNVNICPVCMGHPGALPVINRVAIEKTIKTGLALGSNIPEYSQFDRKNYFYPDLPKGYQISQHKYPLCKNGHLKIEDRDIQIERIHLEEDAGRLIHPSGADYSLVDFNRSGVPLMELVTKPDIHSASEAKKFAEELRIILRYLNVSNADMENGEMRVDANISISSKAGVVDGTKVEIKNLNSFKAIERSLNYEIERQIKLIEKGHKIIQETRGWDDSKGATISQRSKEEAYDYRYFPEPDLPPLYLNDRSFIDIDKIRGSISELPSERFYRLIDEYGLSGKEAEFFVFNKEIGDYYENIVSELVNWDNETRLKTINSRENRLILSRIAANYVLTDLQSLSGGELVFPITAENFAELIYLIYKKEVSNNIAKIVLREMFETGGDPSNIIEEKGLKEINDSSEIDKVIEKVITENPKPVGDYRAGKEESIKFLIGKVMAETRGRANPRTIDKILKLKLKKDLS